MKVFTELTPECDITAQMYAAGYEKKEIAVLKHRAVSTINNQLQTAFLILGVRNGRELALKLAERISGIRLTLDFSPAMRSFVACVLLIILCVDSHLDMKRQRVRICLYYMELDVWQLQKIIKAAAKEAVSEYAISKDPVIDEITETQAIRLGFGRRWLAHQCATGALTWKRAGVHRNSPKVYSLKKLKELKDGIDPLLKSLI